MPRKRKNERADGRIQLSLVIGRDADGKLMRKYFYGATRIAAQRKKEEYQQSLCAAPVRAKTVSEWIDEYLKAYRTKVNRLYIAQDDAPYDRLKREFGTRPINSIREIDLQDALNKV